MSIEYSLKQRKEGQGRAVLYLQPNGNKIYDNSMCHTALLHTQIEKSINVSVFISPKERKPLRVSSNFIP